jgi:ornithine decarboxylase
MAISYRQSPTFREGSRLLQGAFQLDHSTSITELGSLFVARDERPLHRLKRQLADAYGVAWSFPSTHGTTPLNILALLSACPVGGRVLVNRDAHSSVTAAMIQGGFEPVYLVPPYDAVLGLSVGPTLTEAEAMLSQERIDCVFLTSPNYFGIVGDVGEIISAAHRRGIPVVVDAAHAPHFHFCSALPPGAEDLGADYVAQSTHKVATALSQGSLLLVQQERLVEPLYEQINDLGLISTSFSYPILASIELGVRQLVEEGEAIWTAAIDRAEAFRARCLQLDGILCLDRDRVGRPGIRDCDSTRITLDVTETGLSGFDFERLLHEARIYPEMATLRHLLLLVTPGTRMDDLDRLYGALAAIIASHPRRRPIDIPSPPPVPTMAAIPRVAKFAPKVAVPIREAIGRVCGETIATYPPGVPVIAAGEVVTSDIVDYLVCMRDSGAVLKGATDPSLTIVKVMSSL